MTTDRMKRLEAIERRKNADVLGQPTATVTQTFFISDDPTEPYADRTNSRVTVLDYDEVTMTSRVVFPDGYRAVVSTRNLTTREV